MASTREQLAASVSIAVDYRDGDLVVRGSIPVHAVEIVSASQGTAGVKEAADRIRATLVKAAQLVEEHWAADNPGSSTETT